MSFPRYPRYKESGVEWLGEVPEHWTIDRIKRSMASCKNGVWGDDARHDEYDIPCVRVADFDRQRLRVKLNQPTIRNVTGKERIGRLLEQGDLLLEKSGGGDLQPVGCVVIYDDSQPSICSNFIARMQIAAGMNSSFWRYVHAAAYAVRLTTGSINQTSGIQNLDQDRYFNERATFPPHSEQSAIAVFLDRETAKIDALVNEQQRLIELLKEKRQAVISHAVAKGLNPDARMKDSGVEWLGEMPAHWEVKAIRNIANVVRGASPRPAGDPLYFGGDAIPWVTVAEITKNEAIDLTETETFLTDEGARHSNRFVKGTVIYSNSGATLGVPKILRIDACANDGVIAFEGLLPNVHSQFLYHFLASITEFIREKVKQGSGQPNLNTDIVKALRFALPPADEQELIVRHIAELTDRFSRLTTEANTAITLLHERRSALISAAVTGKIDVRGIVPVQRETVVAA